MYNLLKFKFHVNFQNVVHASFLFISHKVPVFEEMSTKSALGWLEMFVVGRMVGYNQLSCYTQLYQFTFMLSTNQNTWIKLILFNQWPSIMLCQVNARALVKK